jgi:hypothetical protein
VVQRQNNCQPFKYHEELYTHQLPSVINSIDPLPQYIPSYFIALYCAPTTEHRSFPRAGTVYIIRVQHQSISGRSGIDQRRRHIFGAFSRETICAQTKIFYYQKSGFTGHDIADHGVSKSIYQELLIYIETGTMIAPKL